MRDIQDDEQRGYRGQPLAAQKARAAPGVRLHRGSSPIARAAAPRRPPGGAPNAARGTCTTGRRRRAATWGNRCRSLHPEILLAIVDAERVWQSRFAKSLWPVAEQPRCLVPAGALR